MQGMHIQKNIYRCWIKKQKSLQCDYYVIMLTSSGYIWEKKHAYLPWIWSVNSTFPCPPVIISVAVAFQM